MQDEGALPNEELGLRPRLWFVGVLAGVIGVLALEFDPVGGGRIEHVHEHRGEGMAVLHAEVGVEALNDKVAFRKQGTE